MMAMETKAAIEIADIAIEIAEEFMATKKLFEKIGYDLVGSKVINNIKYYTAKKKEIIN